MKMYNEDQVTELKLELTKEIKKEIVAFANSNNGTIYVGINDDGEIIGLKNAKKDLEALSCMIREGISSDLTLYTKIYIEEIDGKNIIVVKVSEGTNKPYYLVDKGLKPAGVYIRHGNVSIQASEEVIKKMLLESSNISFENTVSSNQDLHFDYLDNVFKKRDIILDETKYRALNIIDINAQYTNLGLLLSDECPFTIKCAIYNGNDKLEFKDRREFTGSVLKQANDVFEFLDLFNKTSGKIIGLERVDTRDYPPYAIRETLLNAIIHRSYNYTGSILISLYDNRIEFVSLGGLVKGIDLEDLYLGVSETRNPNLANVFFRLKYVESFGTGIGRIIESYKNSVKQPILVDSDNAFKVTLPNINYQEGNENKDKDLPASLTQEERIVEYLKNNNRITRFIVEKLLSISPSRSKQILSKMIKENLIETSGNGKNTCYMLKQINNL